MVSPKVKQSADEYVFSFDETPNLVVNAIRRVILDEVPTFAIEEVEVAQNDSPLYDETLAHRLGLVPLKTDLKSYNFKENCKCGSVGCAMCEVKMTLKSDEEGYVYTSSIKSDDPQIVPIDTKIPLTKLKKNKKVECTLKAVLGRGREHAKWAPAHTYLKESGKKGVDLVIEPYGQLEAKEVYNRAVDIIVEKIDMLEEAL